MVAAGAVGLIVFTAIDVMFGFVLEQLEEIGMDEVVSIDLIGIFGC
jgi:hypothetical protein